MRSRFGLIASVVVAILAVGTGTSFGQGNSPRTEPVSGSFTAEPVNVMLRTCLGSDGEYLELRGKFAGTIVSSDQRLTGVLEFMANPALVNTTTGFGTFQGRFSINDSAGGMQKAQGEFHTVVTNAPPDAVFENHGFAVATVMNQGGGPADNFFARFEATFDSQTLTVTGQFGQGGDLFLGEPAVVQGGHCRGPFTRVP